MSTLWTTDGEGWLWGANSGCRWHLAGKPEPQSYKGKEVNSANNWVRVEEAPEPGGALQLWLTCSFQLCTTLSREHPHTGPDFWPAELGANKWVLSCWGLLSYHMAAESQFAISETTSFSSAWPQRSPTPSSISTLKSSPGIHVSHRWWHGLARVQICPYHTANLEPFHSPHCKVNANRLSTGFQCL